MALKLLEDLSVSEAKEHFLKSSSYFNGDFPNYISFDPLLSKVSEALGDKLCFEFKKSDPAKSSGVNYSFVSNKDGRFAWRPYELMHPAIYVSIVNTICSETNWPLITARLAALSTGAVECCSRPVVSTTPDTDTGAQISNWWQRVEQNSLKLSLEYTHLLHTDVTDCYGSLYTHSIAWAIHGKTVAKEKRSDSKLVGNQIDKLIQCGRDGQTNGISQGSVLMDFVAELVLAYVDELISHELEKSDDFHILRYRDDYRIFTNSDTEAERILKVVSDKLREVGMRLGVAKTVVSRNVVEGSIKEDKLAGISLQDLGTSNAKTVQKQLLRLHAFGQKFPNSGALRRLLSNLHDSISSQKFVPEDLEVQVAIAADIACVSPLTFPAVAGIISNLLESSNAQNKATLWDKVSKKMSTVPYNGYMEIWLQRVVKPSSIPIDFTSDEAICRIVNGEEIQLWNSDWISAPKLLKALAEKLVVDEPENGAITIAPAELSIFKMNAENY